MIKLKEALIWIFLSAYKRQQITEFICLENFTSKSPSIQTKLIALLYVSVYFTRSYLLPKHVSNIESILEVVKGSSCLGISLLELLSFTPPSLILKQSTLNQIALHYLSFCENKNQDAFPVQLMHLISNQIKNQSPPLSDLGPWKNLFDVLENAAKSENEQLRAEAWGSLTLLAQNGIYISDKFISEFQRSFLSERLNVDAGNTLRPILETKLNGIKDAKMKYKILDFLSNCENLYPEVLKSEQVENWITESIIIDMVAPAIDQNDSDSVEMFYESINKFKKFYSTQNRKNKF